MKCFVCIDENLGLSFNNRRLSRDKNVLLDMILDNEKIYMSEYSKKLFLSYGLEKFISEDICDSCFFEKDIDYEKFNKFKTVVIYNWNRHYPSDGKLKFDFNKYKVINILEFKGTSHEIITRTTYEKIVL